MGNERINVPPEGIELVDNESDYKVDLAKHFNQLPEIARPLLNGARAALSKIEKTLYTSPAFINAVKAAVPDLTLQAVLTDEEKKRIAKGALKLMSKKDGPLLAHLIDPKTKKIVKQIPLETVKMSPDLTQAMMSLSMQMQMMQIAEQIQVVQRAVEEVRTGQEFDRLATAYSCQQRFLQAMEIKDPNLRATALIHLTASCEDSRNLLMLSQKYNVKFIADQPESFAQKMISGASPNKISERMNEIRESLCAINMVSFAEAMAYQELGESDASRKSLSHYAEFIEDTYMSVPGLVQRLDLIDPAPKNYWTKTLPAISEMVKALPSVADGGLLERKSRRRKKNDE